MTQVPEAQLRSLADRLRGWAGEVTADNVAAVLPSAVAATADIPGDPDGIEDLGVACKRVADGLDSAGDSLSSVSSRTEAAWDGQAAEAALQRIATERDDTGTEADTLRTIATTLDTLAENARSAHEQHAEVHGVLGDLASRAGALPDGDTEAAAALADQAAAALNGAASLYLALVEAFAGAAASLGSVLYDESSSQFVVDTPAGRRPLEEVLERYQAGDSRSEMVDFPPPDLVDIVNPILNQLGMDVPSSKWTVEELQLFRQLRIDQMYSWYRMQQESYVVSEEQYPGIEHTTHSHTDAFRHAYWNARMTQEFGQEWAEGFATSHERRPGNDMQSEAMDLHNNELGRRIAADNPDASPEQLAQLVGDAVSQGEAIVIDDQSRIAYSDQVEHNATVVPDQHDESNVDPDGAVNTDFEGVRPRGGLPW
ncbi:WXG100 family type VII secretion target [Saccharomonospora piscinae]|uniref:WXG100 family type VII secretion target n=1 Tax=Saccharomonospora piscinae TaxID=687388 RepID=UPI000465A4D6|nr:hypothetical protein [Saccharomonospora piscinae]